MDSQHVMDAKKVVIGPVLKLGADDWSRVLTVYKEEENFAHPEYPMKTRVRITFHASDRESLFMIYE